jgi:hypothetical protein
MAHSFAIRSWSCPCGVRQLAADRFRLVSVRALYDWGGGGLVFIKVGNLQFRDDSTHTWQVPDRSNRA